MLQQHYLVKKKKRLSFFVRKMLMKELLPLKVAIFYHVCSVEVS